MHKIQADIFKEIIDFVSEKTAREPIVQGFADFPEKIVIVLRLTIPRTEYDIPDRPPEDLEGP